MGSSPLARGLHPVVLRGDLQEGIIPARAGFTSRRSVVFTSRGDHPRSRGVYTAHGDHLSLQHGSSPLARGLHRGGAQGGVGRRIIPARAGFTALVPHQQPAGRGSSPLARGLPRRHRLPPGDDGIIPARAGFTGDHDGHVRQAGDHPRSRGVYRTRAGGRGARRGSSPLARGLPVHGYELWASRRIIPARAGFTSSP